MAPPRLALLDYDAGNLRSVARALTVAGAVVEIHAGPDRLGTADALVLPGQGHFRDCAEKLAARGLWQPVQNWIHAGHPFLGICVGYQLLFDSSEEAPGTPGLGVFTGEVKRFAAGEPGVKVPHMGWDTLRLTQPGSPLWEGLPTEPSVYYAHSYYPAPADGTLAAAVTDYGGITFPAALVRDNVTAVQFHPEKSQEVGLTILRNFLRGLEERNAD
jgi:glutamine amidotransferase